MALNITYRLTGIGWVECTVADAGNTCTVTASYLSDALHNLILCANALLYLTFSRRWRVAVGMGRRRCRSSRSGCASRPLARSAAEPAVVKGTVRPNPSFKRTCLRQAA